MLIFTGFEPTKVRFERKKDQKKILARTGFELGIDNREIANRPLKSLIVDFQAMSRTVLSRERATITHCLC